MYAYSLDDRYDMDTGAKFHVEIDSTKRLPEGNNSSSILPSVSCHISPHRHLPAYFLKALHDFGKEVAHCSF
jgi:hypothetical protein